MGLIKCPIWPFYFQPIWQSLDEFYKWHKRTSDDLRSWVSMIGNFSINSLVFFCTGLQNNYGGFVLKLNRMFVGTWNVGGKSPHNGLNLREWLSLPASADIYVLGYCPLIPFSSISNLDPFIVLFDWLVICYQLVGLVSITYE